MSFIHPQFADMKFIDWVYRCNAMMLVVTLLLWLVFWNSPVAFGAYLRTMGLLPGRQGSSAHPRVQSWDPKIGSTRPG